MIDFLMLWIKEEPAKAITSLSAAAGLFAGGIWTALVFFHKILTEREQKQFDRYRLLIRQLQTREDGSAPFVDEQLDAIFQMRFFRKYYPRSLWMLNRLKIRWSKNDNGRSQPVYGKGIMDEIDETIIYIGHRRTRLSSLFFFFKDLKPFHLEKEESLSKIKEKS